MSQSKSLGTEHSIPEATKVSSLIILGMHRSGTSALGGSLGLCGAWLGEEQELTGANAENPKGFWERRDIRKICDQLLYAAGADWWKVADFDPTAIPAETLEECGSAIQTAISELDQHGTWVIKEPRLCLLLPVLRTFVHDPICIHIYRNPLEVANSLQARNRFGIAEGIALWEFYNRSALRASAGLPRILVSYEELQAHPMEAMKKLVGKLKGLRSLDLMVPDDDQLRNFISPDLYRQRNTDAQALEFLSPPQRELWSQLQNEEALIGKIETGLSSVTKQLLRDLELRNSTASKFEAQTREAQKKLEAREAETREAQKKLEAREAETSDIKLQLRNKTLELRALKSSASWKITKPLRSVYGFAQQSRKSILPRGLRKPVKRLRKTIQKRINWGEGLQTQNYAEPKAQNGAQATKEIVPQDQKPYSTPVHKFWWDRFTQALAAEAEPVQGQDVLTALNRSSRNTSGVSVIIPVFNAPDEVAACLRSVDKHSPRHVRVIVIDDSSTDERIPNLLAQYERNPRFEIVRNNENLGYTRTVNRGIELSGQADVILLNSDTKVVQGWITRLRLAAYSTDRTGTATPLSNNAGAFSAPTAGEGNSLPEGVTFEQFARAIAQTSRRLYPRTPTGNGFCMYIRRDCLNEVGIFDAKAFPRGYGEENDFCMRAIAKGWSHVVDDATYIYHTRSASFGEEKQTLMKQGRAVIDVRHPDYTSAVRTFLESIEITEARAAVAQIAEAISDQGASVKPRILYVLPALSSRGGTPQTNQDLMEAIGDRVENFLLRSNGTSLSLFSFREGEYIELEQVRLTESLKAFPHRSLEYDAIVSEWLSRYGIELVHVRHIAFHGLGLIDISKSLNIPVIFSFHDFYTICPTVKLLDENWIFCGGTCTKSLGDCKHDLWKDSNFPPLKHAAIFDWKKMMVSSLQKCDTFITTSKNTRSLIIHNFPSLSNIPFKLIPHGRDFNYITTASANINNNSYDPIRIIIPGSIGYAKGSAIISNLAKQSEDYNFEIHIIGQINENISMPNIIEHGSYRRDEFIEKVQEVKPHLGAVLSIWPETYCHTLTELWAAGVPVIGLDFGAVSERINSTQGGWVLSEPKATEIIELISYLRSYPEEQHKKIKNVQNWQMREGRVHNCAWMGKNYLEIYESLAVPCND